MLSSKHFRAKSTMYVHIFLALKSERQRHTSLCEKANIVGIYHKTIPFMYPVCRVLVTLRVLFSFSLLSYVCCRLYDNTWLMTCPFCYQELLQKTHIYANNTKWNDTKKKYFKTFQSAFLLLSRMKIKGDQTVVKKV